VTYVISDGIDPMPLCAEHLRIYREAADRVGGEPVYNFLPFFEMTRGSRRFRRRLGRPKQYPRVIPADDGPVVASGRAELIPLTETQPAGNGPCIATAYRLVVFATVYPRFANARFEFEWKFLREWHEAEDGQIVCHFGPEAGLYAPSITPHDDHAAWVDLLALDF
jgi:hypothetical protein